MLLTGLYAMCCFFGMRKSHQPPPLRVMAPETSRDLRFRLSGTKEPSILVAQSISKTHTDHANPLSSHKISCLDPSVHGVQTHICEVTKNPLTRLHHNTTTVDLSRDVCRFAVLDVLVISRNKQQDNLATAQLLPRGRGWRAQLNRDFVAKWPVQSLGPVGAHAEASTGAQAPRSGQCRQ